MQLEILFNVCMMAIELKGNHNMKRALYCVCNLFDLIILSQTL